MIKFWRDWCPILACVAYGLLLLYLLRGMLQDIIEFSVLCKNERCV